MAGAGYKLFVSGDVLTAAQVNNYLQQQVTMVFADSTARTTALSGVLAEGMMSYLQDTNAVEVYNGSSWVNVGNSGDITGVTAGTGLSGGGTSGDVTITNSMATAINAKGDLIAGTADNAFDRLAVGNNGETLVADSSATTGLRWQGDYAAGKNKIINGDFTINQRAFSSTTTSGVFTFDRFNTSCTGGTVTYSAQTFTLGTAPVTGYEAKNFIDVATTGQSAAGDFARLVQPIESVRTLANQTVTVSFWAKAASGTPKVAVEIQQVFGTGGSPSSAVNTYFGQATLSTSWARYSVTTTLPSISGKTLGTANDDRLAVNFYTSAGTTFDSRTGSLGTQTATISFWGIQVEAGNVATAFQTATGTLAGELAACQRYYYRETADTTYAYFGFGMATLTTSAKISIPAPVTMRVVPTSIDSPTASTLRFTDGITGTACNASPTLDGDCTNEMLTFNVNVASGLTQYRPVWFGANNSSSAYIGFSAEL